MAKLEVEVAVEWVKQAGNCQPCTACLEIIYGNRYIPEFDIAGKTVQGDIQLCESCYNALIEPK